MIFRKRLGTESMCFHKRKRVLKTCRLNVRESRNCCDKVVWEEVNEREKGIPDLIEIPFKSLVASAGMLQFFFTFFSIFSTGNEPRLINLPARRGARETGSRSPVLYRYIIKNTMSVSPKLGLVAHQSLRRRNRHGKSQCNRHQDIRCR